MTPTDLQVVQHCNYSKSVPPPDSESQKFLTPQLPQHQEFLTKIAMAPEEQIH